MTDHSRHETWTYLTLMVRICGFLIFLVGLLSSWAHAQISSSLLLQNDSFISPDFQATDQTQYQYFGWRARNADHSDPLGVDAEAVIAMGAPLLNYIKVKEFSYKYQTSEKEFFTLGRHHHPWSELDSRWSFGVVEPTFEWNPLNRESLSLTGISWLRTESDYTLAAFWSPLFIPDQGPSFEINNEGRFSRKNPWFQTPPETFRPFPNATSSSKIQYRLERPPDSEIVSQNTLGASIEKNWSPQVLTRLTYFYKPMNQLGLSYKGSYVISTDEGLVDILPQVTLHRIISGDLIWKSGSLELGFSYISDQPTNNPESDPEWTNPRFAEAQITAVYAQLNFLRQKWSLETLSVEGGEVTEVGDLASPDRAAISSRYPMTQAIKLRHQLNFPLKKMQKITWDTSWTTSQKNEFDLIQFRGTFHMNRRWQVYADMQFVKAEPLSAENVNDVASFADNDRLLVGIAHAL